MSTQHELLDTAIKQVGNRYLATMLVAKRIRQLSHGAPAYVQRLDGESFFTVAMREIALGHVAMEPMTEDSEVPASLLAAQASKELAADTPPAEETPAGPAQD